MDDPDFKQLYAKEGHANLVLMEELSRVKAERDAFAETLRKIAYMYDMNHNGDHLQKIARAALQPVDQPADRRQTGNDVSMQSPKGAGNGPSS